MSSLVSLSFAEEKKKSLEELGDVFYMWSQNPEGKVREGGKEEVINKSFLYPTF